MNAAHFYALDCSTMSPEAKRAYKKQLTKEYGFPVHETKDGRIIPVELMTTDHIQNSIAAYIRKVTTLYQEYCQPNIGGARIADIRIESKKCKMGIRILTTALTRRAYIPNDKDWQALSGLEKTLRAMEVS